MAVAATAGQRAEMQRRDVDAGTRVVAEIVAAGGDAVFQRADITSESDIRALIDVANTYWGRLDILVNNAAPSDWMASGQESSAESLSLDGWHYMMNASITGPFLCSKYAIPLMRNSGGGSIVNISSMSSKVGLNGLPAYSAAKGALNALTRQLAVDFGEDGIRVNTIVVGFIDTGTNSSKMLMDDAVAGPQMRALSLTRLGKPEDIAYAALFLCSREAEFITGAELNVDGGAPIRPPAPEMRHASLNR